MFSWKILDLMLTNNKWNNSEVPIEPNENYVYSMRSLVMELNVRATTRMSMCQMCQPVCHCVWHSIVKLNQLNNVLKLCCDAFNAFLAIYWPNNWFSVWDEWKIFLSQSRINRERSGIKSIQVWLQVLYAKTKPNEDEVKWN